MVSRPASETASPPRVLARQAFFHDGLQILLAQDGIENSHFIDDADEERSPTPWPNLNRIIGWRHLTWPGTGPGTFTIAIDNPAFVFSFAIISARKVGPGFFSGTLALALGSQLPPGLTKEDILLPSLGGSMRNRYSFLLAIDCRQSSILVA